MDPLPVPPADTLAGLCHPSCTAHSVPPTRFHRASPSLPPVSLAFSAQPRSKAPCALALLLLALRAQGPTVGVGGSPFEHNGFATPLDQALVRSPLVLVAVPSLWALCCPWRFSCFSLWCSGKPRPGVPGLASPIRLTAGSAGHLTDGVCGWLTRPCRSTASFCLRSSFLLSLLFLSSPSFVSSLLFLSWCGSHCATVLPGLALALFFRRGSNTTLLSGACRGRCGPRHSGPGGWSPVGP